LDELLNKLLEGIDPDDPHAVMKLFWRMMGMIDWWEMFWLTLLCGVVGGVIGHFKKVVGVGRGIGLGLTLGPIGWGIALFWRSRPSNGAQPPKP
jgi:hypothetical protein